MKIYVVDNYFVVEYSDGFILEGLAKNVFIKRDNRDKTLFYIFGVPGGVKLETEGVTIGDIKDQSGTVYTLNTWTTFYSVNTGN